MDRNGMTPLMWASYRSFGIDPLRLSLNFGASVNYCDSNYKNTGVQNFIHTIQSVWTEIGFTRTLTKLYW